MGRMSTGAITTNEVRKVRMKHLQERGFFKEGLVGIGTIGWNSGGEISVTTNLVDMQNPFIELAYFTALQDGRKKEYRYKVYLDLIPSNLGKGFIYYFICPFSGVRCRDLYKCYSSEVWKARAAYKNRIYYSTQLESKKWRPLRWMFTDNLLEELCSKKVKSHYQGKPTKLVQKIAAIEKKQDDAYWLANACGFGWLISPNSK